MQILSQKIGGVMEGLIFRFQKVIEEVAAGNRSLFSRETGKAPSFATDVCKGRILPTIQIGRAHV